MHTVKARLFYLMAVGILATLVGSKAAHAQQVPLTSNYLYNEYLVNPAAVGLRGELDAALLYRRQFVDVPGAPEHLMAAIDGFYDTKNFGAGLMLFNQTTGVLQKTGGSLAYAYRKYVGDNVAIRAGFNGMVARYGIDWNQVVMQDETELGSLRTSGDRTIFDGGFGVFAEISDLNVGVSMAHLFNTDANFESIDNSRALALQQTRHLIGYADYTFEIDDLNKIKPVVVTRTSSNFEFQYDINAQYQFNDAFFFNLGYLSDYAINAGFGVQLQDAILFSYNYDFPFGDMGQASQGSHEVMVSYRIGDVDGKSVKEMEEELNYLRNMQDKLREDVDTLKSRVDSNEAGIEQQQKINERQQEAIDELMNLKEQNQEVIDSILQKTGLNSDGSGEIAPMNSGKGSGRGPGGGNRDNGSDAGPAYNFFDIEAATDIPDPYKVVVGSFRKQENAMRYQQEVKRLGVTEPTQIVRTRKGPFFDAGDWYFVSVNGFGSPQEAQAFVRKYSDNNQLELNGNPWIYVVPKR